MYHRGKKLPLRSQEEITYWSFKSCGSEQCWGVWADAPLQVCSVTSFSKVSNNARVFQSFLHWPSARKKMNTISIVLLGKAFPLEFSCARRRSYHSLCCSSHTAHSPLLQCRHARADMDAPFSFTEVFPGVPKAIELYIWRPGASMIL